MPRPASQRPATGRHEIRCVSCLSVAGLCEAGRAEGSQGRDLETTGKGAANGNRSPRKWERGLPSSHFWKESRLVRPLCLCGNCSSRGAASDGSQGWSEAEGERNPWNAMQTRMEPWKGDGNLSRQGFRRPSRAPFLFALRPGVPLRLRLASPLATVGRPLRGLKPKSQKTRGNNASGLLLVFHCLPVFH